VVGVLLTEADVKSWARGIKDTAQLQRYLNQDRGYDRWAKSNGGENARGTNTARMTDDVRVIVQAEVDRRTGGQR